MIFLNSLAKIRRGEELMDALDFQVRKAGREAHHRVSINHDLDAGCDTATVTVEEFSTESLSLILGDALHNFHTALDFAWSDIEFACTAKRSNYTKFPCGKTEKEVKRCLESNLHKGKITDSIAKYILDTVQPYEAGNGQDLFALHDLDIRDKHELLIPYAAISGVFGVTFKNGNNEEFSVPSWLGVGHRSQHARLYGHTNAEVVDDGTVAFAVFFPNDQPLAGREVLVTMRGLAHQIRRTVRGIPL